MLLVLEAYRERLEHAGAFDIDAFVTVDQDVVDRRVLEQRLEWTQTGHFVENFGDEIAELLGIERKALDQHILRNQLLDVPADFVFRHFFQRRKVDFLDQTAMQTHFGVEQLIAEQADFQSTGGGALPPALREKRSRTRLQAPSDGISSTAGNSGDAVTTCGL